MSKNKLRKEINQLMKRLKTCPEGEVAFILDCISTLRRKLMDKVIGL